MNKRLKSLVILCFTLNTAYCQTQISKKEQTKKFNSGSQLIFEEKFDEAARIFEELLILSPDDTIIQYNHAICKINDESSKEQALKKLLSLQNSKNLQKFQYYNYYLGRALYYNNRFDEAKQKYEEYYQETLKENIPELTKHIKLLMDYCDNAKFYSKNPVPNVKINSIGTPINTDGHEYSPYLTPGEDIIVYTYRGPQSTGGKMNSLMRKDENGKYFEDIFLSYKNKNEIWEEPIKIKEINELGHDAAAGLSANGDHLFIYRNNSKIDGDIYESFLDKFGNWSEPVKMIGEINSLYWEGGVAITIDEKTLYFSSNRPGGFGGSDLYSVKLQSDGSWGELKNLGPEINSEKDEDAPFIHYDDKTLYFSSNNSKSMGGYDVFSAVMDENGNFQNSTNLKAPYNSIDDDRFFILSPDADRGYFARLNKSTSNNHEDIFIFSPGRSDDPPAIEMVKGQIYLDDTLRDGVIITKNLETNEIEGTFKTNPFTKTYTMLINSQDDLSIETFVDGKSRRLDTLHAKYIDRFVEVENDFRLYSDESKNKKQISLDENLLKTYNEITGYEKADSIDRPTKSLILTKTDSTYFHDISDLVKENRIEYYETHPDEAKNDGINNSVLKAAKDNIIKNNTNSAKVNVFLKSKTKLEAAKNQLSSSSTDPKTEKEINHMFHPTFKASDLVYRVQIAAYRNPKNYVWPKRKMFGDAMDNTYPDGITRFTIGGTKHLDECEELRQKLIVHGIEDAFIVAFRGEERIPLYEINRNKQ